METKKEVNIVHCGVVLPNLNVTEVFEKLILVGQYFILPLSDTTFSPLPFPHW